MNPEGPKVGQIELTEEEQKCFLIHYKRRDKQFLLDYLFYLSENNKKIDFKKTNKILLKKTKKSELAKKFAQKNYSIYSKQPHYDSTFALEYANIPGVDINLIYNFIVKKLKDPYSALKLAENHKNELINTTELEDLICKFWNGQLVMQYCEIFSVSKPENKNRKIRPEILAGFRSVLDNCIDIDIIRRFEYLVPEYAGSFEEQIEIISQLAEAYPSQIKKVEKNINVSINATKETKTSSNNPDEWGE